MEKCACCNGTFNKMCHMWNLWSLGCWLFFGLNERANRRGQYEEYLSTKYRLVISNKVSNVRTEHFRVHFTFRATLSYVKCEMNMEMCTCYKCQRWPVEVITMWHLTGGHCRIEIFCVNSHTSAWWYHIEYGGWCGKLHAMTLLMGLLLSYSELLGDHFN